MRLGEFLHHDAHRIRDGIERSSLQVSRDPKRIRRPVKSYPSRFLPRPSHRHRPGYSGSTRHVARGAADDGRAIRTGEDLCLYAGFRWEHARHDPHRPHRDVAFRAVRFAHKDSLVRPETVAARLSTPDLAMLMCH
jgi:hypothetical protein